MKLVPRWEIDEKQAPLVSLVEGKIPAFIYCGGAMDVRVAIEVAESNGFLHKTTLVVSGDCDRAAAWIAERGIPVILTGSLTRAEIDEETDEMEDVFIPKVYADAGVRFALRSANSTTARPTSTRCGCSTRRPASSPSTAGPMPWSTTGPCGWPSASGPESTW